MAWPILICVGLLCATSLFALQLADPRGRTSRNSGSSSAPSSSSSPSSPTTTSSAASPTPSTPSPSSSSSPSSSPPSRLHPPLVRPPPAAPTPTLRTRQNLLRSGPRLAPPLRQEHPHAGGPGLALRPGLCPLRPDSRRAGPGHFTPVPAGSLRDAARRGAPIAISSSLPPSPSSPCPALTPFSAITKRPASGRSSSPS